MNWIQLTQDSQLEKLKKDSFEKMQLIFKHSTRCSISQMILSRFESSNQDSEYSAYFLDLLSFRTISNVITIEFDVRHESPQLLVIKDGKCHAHASHSFINQLNLSE
jgi:bacillithiol system protein YtxJ